MKRWNDVFDVLKQAFTPALALAAGVAFVMIAYFYGPLLFGRF